METNLKNWIVYCTINTINHKFYIGVHKTNDPTTFDGYIGCDVNINYPSSYKNPQTPFQFAVKKYGCDKFIRVVLKSNLTKEEALNIEKKLVNKEFIKRKDTYNISVGGNGGKLEKEVYQFSYEGTLIKKWDSVKSICCYYGCTENGLYEAIRNKTSRSGYYWSFSDTINSSLYINNNSTKIFQYDGDSYKLINSYDTISSASRELGIKKDLIQRSIKCGYKTGGYYFSKVKMESYTCVEAKRIGNSPIYIYSLNGEFIKSLNNKEEIFKFFGIKTLSQVRDAIRGKVPYKGYQISLVKLDKLPETIDKRNIKKPVGKYTLDGVLVKTYDTVTQAREEHGVGVSRCLKGIQHTCANHIFKYIS